MLRVPFRFHRTARAGNRKLVDMIKKSDIKEIVQIISLSFVFAAMVGGAYAWQIPVSNPPENNSSPYINASLDSQTKSGPLWANSFLTEGSGYFGGNVGIGVTNPQAKLHIGGTVGVDGIMFPDGTIQTTAAN